MAMFSTMHNQKKAESLIRESRERIEEAENRYHRSKEALLRAVEKLDRVRSHLAGKSLARFRELFNKMENEPAIELPPVAEQPVAEQIRPLLEKSAIEPVTIEPVEGGKASAFFASLVAVIVTLAAAAVIGAVGSGLPLSPETFTDQYKILHILEWLGGGALGFTAANPIWGAIGLGLAVVAVWLITWSIFMGKAARRNRQKAEEVREEAERYATKRETFAEEFETLAEELLKLERFFETCDIYMQEFNASLRRILFTEGADYTQYREPSKTVVRRAAECAMAVAPSLGIAVITTEGAPSSHLRHTLVYGEAVTAALLEQEEIPSEEALREKLAEERSEPIILPYKKEDSETTAESESLKIPESGESAAQEEKTEEKREERQEA
jgi:hypothetical protein